MGTRHKLTTHDTPQHNGIVERAHRTLFNGVRAALSSSRLPHWTWGYALDYCVHIWNRTPHKPIGMKTPFEMRFNKQPDLSNIHPFGCIVYVTKKPTSKLEERGLEGRWIGLDPTSNGHRIYWPSRRTISVEQDIVFTKQEISRIEGEYKELSWDLDNKETLEDIDSIS